MQYEYPKGSDKIFNYTHSDISYNTFYKSLHLWCNNTYELYKKNRKRTVTGSFPKIIYAKDMKETTEYEE